MPSFYSGIAGARGYNPLGFILHNDAGSKYANVAFYKGWLPSHDAYNGFAHYYIAEDGTYQAESDSNIAWHAGNSYYNQNFIGLEACQSMGDYGTFLKNEAECLKLIARLCKKYGITPTRQTIILHQEASPTSCPHRSYDLHGRTINQVKDYFISEIKKYMNGGTTVTKPKQPQGDWISENKRVEVTTKNQNTFLDFKWKVCHPTNQILGKQYVVTGKYNHQNGETYYSLYDVQGSWHGYINKKFVKEIKAIYQTIPGLYEALKDDTFYIDQNLKKKSAWKIKRGQTFHLEDIVTVGKYTRAKVRLNNDIRYCTMRDDYWKLKYKTKVVKIK
ncbi:N-acetylmuramoyl-L-alanine amidase [Vagococcus carniphilus]|uniref:peptidoglycan recognition protein family protein n=1 Tax=Vagococcus carniphilus TaxID=218144 RepID=UPI003BAB47B8